MTAITSFPDILTESIGDYESFKLQAYTAISRGQVVTINSLGMAVPVPITGTPNAALGVAFDSVGQYEHVTIIYRGVVNVANGTSGTDISIGSGVKTGGAGGYAGAVVAATVGTDTCIIGTALELISGGSYGKIMLKPRGQYYK